jgi:NIMA (never in mitosis gene a)-related kinase
MLQVNPTMRPSSEKLLQSSILLKKGEELNIGASETASSISQLLRTIRIPKNLHYLTDRLPKPNYMR